MESSYKGFPSKRLPDKHIDIVGHVGHSSSMTLSLPKPGINILEDSFSCLNRQLIKRSVNRNGNDLSLSFPEGLFSHMKVFSNSIRTSIPPSDSLGNRIVKRIVGKRIGDIEDTETVGGVC